MQRRRHYGKEDSAFQILGLTKQQIRNYRRYINLKRGLLRRQLPKLLRTGTAKSLTTNERSEMTKFLHLERFRDLPRLRLPFASYHTSHQLVINALCHAAPEKVTNVDCETGSLRP